LGSCVDAVYHCVVKRIPEFDCFVSRTAAAGEDSVIVGAPGDSFDSCAVGGKLTNGGRTLGAPNEQLIVVSSRSEEVIVERPFQSTDLLRVTLIFIDYSVVPLPNISHLNASVPGATRKNAVPPGNRADSSRVATILVDPATLSDIPHLDGPFRGSNSDLRALLIPIQAGY
jgi:hypothetical protein